MKKIFLILLVLIVCISKQAIPENILIAGKATLSGKITDKKTGESIPGVSIYFPDLKTGTISSADGTYKIENLAKTKVLVNVSFVGFKLISESIDLSIVTIKDFVLEESVTELNEVVVTGLSKAAEKNRNPAPVIIIPPIQLLQNSSANIIDALSRQPGISQVTTGSGISKPVIRGLGYNRVVTINDGIRQEGQQWGDEHGIEIDEFSINKVEILKGPASLSYGSDAMAGVINLMSSPTLPDGKVIGNILADYQTNNGLIAYSANFAGNKKGMIWNVRYSNKMAHAYQNKYDGYVFNSGFKENGLSGTLGTNKSWGYSHINFSVYNLTPGILEGERDSLTGKFLKPISINDTLAGTTIATEDDFKSYSVSTPYQKVHHYKVVWNNSFIIGDGTLKATIGWQQNRRQEYGDILDVNRYGLYFFLNTVNYDVRYILPEKNNLIISFGFNGMWQKSQNKGTEFLIPDYSLFDIGLFAVAKKTIGKLDISGGLRYDSRTENGNSLFLNSDGIEVNEPDSNSYQQFAAFNSSFTGISGSVGIAYQFSEKVYSKLNLSRGFRGPDIAELGSNGLHEGTDRYEIGDPGLEAENSLQLDYALGFNSMHISAELDLFKSSISNYIFLSKIGSVSGGDSITQGYSTFKFVSGDADLTGGEFSIDIHPHPLDWLHFENTFSFVQSTQENQPDTSKYLPMTPPTKITTELRATTKKIGKYLTNAYALIGMDNYFAQNKFYGAYGTETATPGYTLFGLGFGTDFIINEKTLFSIYVSANNITDVAYQSHLSRLKYGAVNYATGRTGVYNVGRNFSFKLIVPFDFSKK